ncbi:MAG: orotidine-5'-phosphate decarboxylase [Gammaproteobacteria bacterium]
MSHTESRIIVALDYADAADVWQFVDQIDPGLCRLKVGKELFTHEGPALVRQLVARGYDVFLDLKFHDIPNTVARACSAAADLGVWMMNVHASGGRRMMQAAREALDSYSRPPLLIAVTVLTSMAAEDLQEIGLEVSPETQVMRLARLAQAAGMDGVVCSAMETSVLAKELGSDFCLVTPGIRPAGSDQGDQRRIMTPLEAMHAGSHYLVIGRPITQAASPLETLVAINAQIAK